MSEILHHGDKSRYINSLLIIVGEYVNQGLGRSEFENIFKSIWFAKRPDGQRRLTKKEEFLFWVSLLEKKNSEFSNVFRELILEYKIKLQIYNDFFYIYTPDNRQIPKQAVALLELAALTDQSTQLLTFLIFRGLKPNQGYPIRETRERTPPKLSRVILPNGAQQDCIRACKNLFYSLEDYKENRFDWSNNLASAYSTEVGKEFIHDCLLRMADELVALSKPIDEADSKTETENSLLISEETLSQEGTILVPLSKSSPLKDLTMFPILVQTLKALIKNMPHATKSIIETQTQALFNNITSIIQITIENLPEALRLNEGFTTALTKCIDKYYKCNATVIRTFSESSRLLPSEANGLSQHTFFQSSITFPHAVASYEAYRSEITLVEEGLRERRVRYFDNTPASTGYRK